jgi:rhodanese-related sulfurtransferase
LRTARLVDTERTGKYITYRIASAEVPHFWTLLRTLAEDRLFELQDALRNISASTEQWVEASKAELLRKAKKGDVTVLDVRPQQEFDTQHIPFARSIPIGELRARLAERPKDKPIVAYCRGPYCLMSADAVAILKEHGFCAYRLPDSVIEYNRKTN